jgi:signal peptide peptidase SppA
MRGLDRFPHLAQRLFNVPLAIMPQKAEVVMAALADRLGIAQLFRANGETVLLAPKAFYLDDDGPARADPYADKGYDLVGPVALIPVEGTLVQKTGTLRPYSGMTGYDGIRQNFFTALADPAVKAIALDIDSPGGEVAGCFDLVDALYAARGTKPVWAILDESACSAAYALASACDRITVPRSGVAGSIGVICLHVDWSKALEKEGIAVTFIQYGAAKSDGAPEKPLSAEALARFQGEIDRLGDLFVATVARNRGVDAASIRAQEARTFMGDEALMARLADEIAAPDQAFRALVASL